MGTDGSHECQCSTMYKLEKSLYCTLRTNVILYASETQIKLITFKKVLSSGGGGPDAVG